MANRNGWRRVLVETSAILKGMAVTFRYLFRRPVTIQYPEERPTVPRRFRNRKAHLPRRMIRNKPHRIDRLTRTADGDEEAFAGQVGTACVSGRPVRST